MLEEQQKTSSTKWSWLYTYYYLPGTAGFTAGSQVYGTEYQFLATVNFFEHNVPYYAACFVPQLSWFLLSLCAHHPGPGSTTAIWHRPIPITIDHLSTALTWTLKSFLVLSLTQMELLSTMLILPVMALLVLRTWTGEYSLVLCVPSEHSINRTNNVCDILDLDEHI